MAGSNQTTLTSFLTAVGSQNIQNVMTQFCQDGTAGGITIPCVAITEHVAAVGPAFFGTSKVRKLFNRLFLAFPDVTLTPLNPASPLFLTSSDGGTIGLQTTLAGTQQDWWFPPADADKYYSKPLSDIPPNNVKISIAACAVFTFNASYQITQLAIYMDRYKFISILAPSMATQLESIYLRERVSHREKGWGMTGEVGGR
jgi:hypothetical protein